MKIQRMLLNPKAVQIPYKALADGETFFLKEGDSSTCYMKLGYESNHRSLNLVSNVIDYSVGLTSDLVWWTPHQLIVGSIVNPKMELSWVAESNPQIFTRLEAPGYDSFFLLCGNDYVDLVKGDTVYISRDEKVCVRMAKMLIISQ